MRKRSERFLAILLSVAILIPTMPTMVFAESVADTTAVEQTENNAPVEPTAKGATAPTGAVNLTYTGSELCLVGTNPSTTDKQRYRYGTTVVAGVPATTHTAGETTKTDAGTYTVYWSYQEKSMGWWQKDSGSFEVTIGKATPTAQVTAKGSQACTGSALNLIQSATAMFNGKDIGAEFEYSVDGGSYSSTATATTVGTHTIAWRTKETSNFKSISGSTTAEIAEVVPSVTINPNSKLTYTGKSQKLIASASSDRGTLQFKVNSGDWTTDLSKLTRTNAGTYTVYYKVDKGTDDKGAYSAVSGSVQVTINKADIPSSCLPTEKGGLIYNGKAQALVDESKLPAGTNAYYRVTTAVGVFPGSDQDEVPTGTNPLNGSVAYYIAYRIDGGQNYNDVDFTRGLANVIKKNFDVYINKAPLYSIELNESTPFTYDGTEKTVTVSKVYAGKKGDLVEVPSDEYSVTGDTSATKPGTYTLTAKLKNSSVYYVNPDTDLTLSWKINKSNKFANGALTIADADGKYTVDGTSFEFNNSAFTPKFKVMADGEELDSKYYDITGDTSKTNVGTYTITATGKGDYAGSTATATWKISNVNIKTATISFTEKTYNGKNQMPTVTEVKDTYGKLVDASNYSVAYKNSKGETVTEAKNAGTYTVVITGTNNYAGVIDTLTWEIKKADIPESCLPTERGGLVYNGKEQALIDESKLPEGTNAYYRVANANIFPSKDQDEVPTATNPLNGSLAYYVAYRIDGGDNYNDVDFKRDGLGVIKKNFDVYINKATLYSVEVNEDTPFTYDGSEKSVTIKKVYAGKKGDLVEVPSDVYTASGDTKATKAGTYTMTVKIKTASLYYKNPETDLTYEWTINKSYKFENGALTIKDADGNYSVDKASYGFTGSAITPEIKLMADGEELDSKYYDLSGDTSKTNVGTYTITATGKGDYAGNTATATWTITNAKIKEVSLEYTSKMYDGTSYTPSVTEVKDSNGKVVSSENYTVTYKDATGAEVTEAKNAGKYTVTVAAKEGTNYSDSADATYEITKSDYLVKNKETLVVANKDLKYTGKDQELVTISDELEGDVFKGVVVYFKTSVVGEPSTTIPTGNKAYVNSLVPKEYLVYYKIDGGNNYETVDFGLPFLINIGKGTPTVTVTTNTELEYDGTPQALVASATADFGEVQLNYKKKDDADWLLTEWVKEDDFGKIVGTDAGTYVIGYKVEADVNWVAVESKDEDETYKHYEVEISSKAIKEDWISLKNMPWNGEEQSVEITVKDPDLKTTLEEDVDYTVSGDRTATDPGTYTVTIKGIGNYKGEFEKTWKIIDFKAVLDNTEFTYDGKEHSVKVSVTKVDGEELEEVKDYVVLTSESTFSATEAGTYIVKIQGQGEYEDAGIIDLEWTINPAELEDGDISLSRTWFVWTGKEKSVTATVKHRLGSDLLKTTLVEGVDYEIVEDSIFAASDAGEYTVSVKGINNYAGQVDKTWTIQGIPMSHVLVTTDETTYEYDATEHGPALTVELGLLKENEDYVIEGVTKATDAGEYEIIVRGKGKYYGTQVIKWTIEPKDLEDCQSVLINKTTGVPMSTYEYLPTDLITYKEDALIVDANLLDQTDDAELVKALLKGDFTEAIVTKLTGAKVNVAVLEEGEDYTLEGDFEKKANQRGVYHITANGEGNYTGEVTKEWVIALQSEMVKNDSFRVVNDKTTYSGNAIKPQLQVKQFGSLDWKDIEDVDGYEVTDANGVSFESISEVNAGTYKLHIEGIEAESKYGSTDITWTIEKKKVIVKYDKTETVYDGTVQRPVLSFDGIVDADKDKVRIHESKAISLLEPRHAGTYYMYTQVTFAEDFNKDNYDFVMEGEDQDTLIGYIKNLLKEQTLEEKIKDKIRELIGKVTEDQFYATKFVINKRPVGVEWSKDEFTYDGFKHAPTATATNMVAGDYCKLSVEGEQKNAGTYTAKVSGLSWLTGLVGDYELVESESTHEFVINPKSISETSVVAIEKLLEKLVYNAEMQKPELSVKDLLTLDTLEEGKDYVVNTSKQSDFEAIDAGSYVLLINGKGNYCGETTVVWEIGPRQITDRDVKVALSEDTLVYNAKVQGPEVKASYKSVKLEEGVDFYLTGTTEAKDVYNILGISDYTIYVHGDGNFTGKVQRDWDLVPLDLNKVTPEITLVDKTFNGKKQMPEATKVVVDGNEIPLGEVAFSKRSAATNAGKHAATLVGEVKFNRYLNYNVINGYSFEWEIQPKVATDDEFDIDMGSYTYNYKKQTVDPTIVDKETGATLVEGKDYEFVSGQTYKNVGTYTVTIKFINNYKGSFDKEWAIVEADINEASVTINDLTFNGKDQAPDITVKMMLAGEEVTLKEGTDYVLKNAAGEAFGKQCNVGSYYVAIVGIDNFKNLADGYVSINPLDITETVDAKTVESMIYTSVKLEPEVSAEVVLPGDEDATVLKEQTEEVDGDFTVEYVDNREVGTATVNVTFVNNYTGTATLNFEIVYGEEHQATFYIKNGGNYDVYDVQDSIPHEGKVVRPENPEKSGYIFAGWTVLTEGAIDEGEVYLFDEPLMRDIKLVAKWVDEKNVESVVVDTEGTDITARSSLNVKDVPLTDAEEAAIALGHQLNVKMTVAKSKDATSEEKDAIKELLKAKQKVGMYLDITIDKFLDGNKSGEVHETLNPVTITVTIPKSMRVQGRLFSIVRVHNGEAEVIAENLKPDSFWNISFESDRFSTYALVLDDKKVVNTGDSNLLIPWIAVALLTAAGIVVLCIKRKRRA